MEVDVTKKANITDAFSQIKNTLGHRDVLFNNVGISALGKAGGTPR